MPCTQSTGLTVWLHPGTTGLLQREFATTRVAKTFSLPPGTPIRWTLREVNPRGIMFSDVVLDGHSSQWLVRESNPLRTDLQSAALPFELTSRVKHFVTRAGFEPSSVGVKSRPPYQEKTGRVAFRRGIEPLLTA